MYTGDYLDDNKMRKLCPGRLYSNVASSSLSPSQPLLIVAIVASFTYLAECPPPRSSPVSVPVYLDRTQETIHAKC